MKYRIVSNNPMVSDKFGGSHNVEFRNVSAKEILCIVGDMVSEGYALLNHPLYGSVKPNETPYRTILLAKEGSSPFATSLAESSEMILKAHAVFEKFTDKQKVTDAALLADYQLVDLALASSAVEAADR